MKSRIVFIVMTVAIILPFLVNLLGWSIYAYFNFGEKDLILASTLGVSHNAWAEHYEEKPAFGVELSDDFTTTILDTGFFNLFLERRDDPMTPLSFQWIKSDEYFDYRGFEFPWLLFFPVPLTIVAGLKLKRRQNSSPQ